MQNTGAHVESMNSNGTVNEIMEDIHVQPSNSCCRIKRYGKCITCEISVNTMTGELIPVAT